MESGQVISPKQKEENKPLFLDSIQVGANQIRNKMRDLNVRIERITVSLVGSSEKATETAEPNDTTQESSLINDVRLTYDDTMVQIQEINENLNRL